VNRLVGDDGAGDRVPLERVMSFGSLRWEGKLRRAGTHSGEGDGKVAGNGMNPRVGSGLQDVRAVQEAKAVEVV